MKKGTQTKYGTVQQVTQYGPGIVSFMTASHGGFQLSPDYNKRIHAVWRLRGGCYEEDCKWAIVAVTFPNRFTPENVKLAHATLKNNQPDEYAVVFGTAISVAESRVLRERAAKAEAAGKLQVIAAWGEWHKDVPKDMVGVCATVDGDREGIPRYFLIPADEYNISGLIFVVDPERHKEVERIG
jgi:hypothetical protein